MKYCCIIKYWAVKKLEVLHGAKSIKSEPLILKKGSSTNVENFHVNPKSDWISGNYTFRSEVFFPFF